MVRLRREIEGIQPDLHASPPAWAEAPAVSAALTPAWDAETLAEDASRVLLAGALRLDLAVKLAHAGRFVTICDLLPDDVPLVHRRLEADVAGRVQLVGRPYGETSFAASSFDLAVFTDTLHLWAEPTWVAHKLARELKVEGRLRARLWGAGTLAGRWAPPHGQDERGVPHGAGSSAWPAPGEPRGGAPMGSLRGARRLPHPGLALAPSLATLAGLPLWLARLTWGPAGLEALERGALPRALLPARDATSQVEAIDAHLRVERLHSVASERAALAALAALARAPWRAAAAAGLAAERESSGVSSGSHAREEPVAGVAGAPAPAPTPKPTVPPDGAQIVLVYARRALGDRRHGVRPGPLAA